MPRTKAIVGIGEIAGLMKGFDVGETAVAIFHHGYSRRVAGVIRLCHRYSFYSFNAEKFNSFYSKINEWPRWSKDLLVDKHAGGGQSTSKSTCEVPARTLTA